MSALGHLASAGLPFCSLRDGSAPRAPQGAKRSAWRRPLQRSYLERHTPIPRRSSRSAICRADDLMYLPVLVLISTLAVALALARPTVAPISQMQCAPAHASVDVCL